MMKLQLNPVYSQPAVAADVPDAILKHLPKKTQLSQHQLDTYNALMNKEADVVINTAMTGDGKSLAAYLPTLVNPRHNAFAMYPTIELSRDQERQFRGYAEDWGCHITYDALWGAKLGSLARENDFKRRGEILKERFSNYQVLLTNPDIFNLVMNYRYGSTIFTDQELPYSLGVNFNEVIFDEFHIFSMPQIVSAITAMLYLIERDPRNAPRFLFSSATPDPVFLDMLKRAGLSYKEIEGNYHNHAGEGWRHVLHTAELSLHRMIDNESIEQWLVSHIDIIKTHWQSQGPRPKGAIILNSVATARRAARVLREQLGSAISVGEVTGLIDDDRRRAAMKNADLIVGTSTIDVGIDFNISLLIFESPDGGTFLQRLGRLGRVRHNAPAFEHYEAHALFSSRTPWLLERLQEKLTERGVIDGDAVERPTTLRDAVREAFPVATSFKPYARRWGALQGAHVITALEHYKRNSAYTSQAAALRERYAKLFNLDTMDKSLRHYHACVNSKQPKTEISRGKAILNEAISFRGSSPFQAAVWDTTVDPPAFLSYDALALARNTQFSVVSEQQYLEAAATANVLDRAREDLKWAIKGVNEQPLILQIHRFMDTSAELLLDWIGKKLRDYTRQVCVVKGCSVVGSQSSLEIGTLNLFLSRQRLVCYFTDRDISELRWRLRLPAQFPLYRVRQVGFNKDYTVAFGKEALMLDAEMLKLRDKDEANEPIIC